MEAGICLSTLDSYVFQRYISGPGAAVCVCSQEEEDKRKRQERAG